MVHGIVTIGEWSIVYGMNIIRIENDRGPMQEEMKISQRIDVN